MGEVASAFGPILWALLMAVSIYIYGALFRQITHRAPQADERFFDWPEAILAGGIFAFFGYIAFRFFFFGANAQPDLERMSTLELFANALFPLFLVGAILLFLKLRRFDVSALAGFSRLSLTRVLATAFVLLIIAYPLLGLADWITTQISGGGASRQTIVEIFSGTQKLGQRIIIIFIAVVVAPIAEEFIFRFFIYGVMRRFAGRAIALLASALLFAAVHTHLPSFAPLFVLGLCLTLAYEWSGSLLVSMSMHSIFNSLTLLALAFSQSP